MKRIKSIDINSIDIHKTFLEVNAPNWRETQYVPIKTVFELLEIEFPASPNVKLVTFEDQDVSINKPPNTYPLDHPLHLAVDENFLYVWINERWKRVPLSSF